MPNAMMQICETQDTGAAHQVSRGMRGDPLKMLLMDDDSFDRRSITRLCQKSRFKLEVIEATSIADAEIKFIEQKPDLVFLDYRVPDGDGISFSQQLSRRMEGTAPPVVIVTGEGDESTAIRSLRSGVADYLCKDTLSVEVFDRSIERCLAVRSVNTADLMNEIDRVNGQLSTLRETTRRNMHMARAFMLPMADYAWQSIKPLAGEARKSHAARLMKITQRLTGLLDEALIASSAEVDDGARTLVDMRALLHDLLADTPDLSDYIQIGDQGRFPEIAASKSQMMMMLKELIGEALASVPTDRKPLVRIDCATDPKGNPILCVTDNGDGLAERKKGLADYAEGIGHSATASPGRATRMSLCQRLAEMNGGQLRMADAPDGGCRVMVRFPRNSTEMH